jgi:hypothetical protein
MFANVPSLAPLLDLPHHLTTLMTARQLGAAKWGAKKDEKEEKIDEVKVEEIEEKVEPKEEKPKLFQPTRRCAPSLSQHSSAHSLIVLAGGRRGRPR